MDPLDCTAELVSWERESAIALWVLALAALVLVAIEAPRVCRSIWAWAAPGVRRLAKRLRALVPVSGEAPRGEW